MMKLVLCSRILEFRKGGYDDLDVWGNGDDGYWINDLRVVYDRNKSRASCL